jgi:hypothetical protein
MIGEAPMADPVQFKPLKETGVLSLTDSSEIRFYVDEYKGYPYASIRTFIKRDNYSGPTKAGLTLNPGLLQSLIGVLEKLPEEPASSSDVELARFPKKAGLELVVRITIYRDTTGIDLREWVDDGTYQGWSKKGVRIAYGELAKTLAFLRETQAFLRTVQKRA